MYVDHAIFRIIYILLCVYFITRLYIEQNNVFFFHICQTCLFSVTL